MMCIHPRLAALIPLALALAVACARTASEGTGTAVAGVAAPGGRLDKETAKELLLAGAFEKGIGYCAWMDARKQNERGLTFVETATTAKCATQLEGAGLARRGACLEGDPRDCTVSFVTAAGPTEVDDDNIFSLLRFPCGKLRLVDVVSITTKEPEQNKARVVFRRRFDPDRALLGKVDLCHLEKPKEGESELTWTFLRNDDGKWTVPKDQPRFALRGEP